MGWFDSQIKKRKKMDDAAFDEALRGVGAAIIGKRLASALENDGVTQNAIDEVLKYYHIPHKEIEVPKDVKTIDGQIEYRTRMYGIMHREVKLEKKWYLYAVGAMLGTLKSTGKAVALIPGKISGYYYVDFSTGKRVRINKKTAKDIDENATCFYKPLPLKKLRVRDLFVYMVKAVSVSDIIIYLASVALITLVGMLSPILTKMLFGPVLESQDIKLLVSIGVFMICFAITQLLIAAFQTFVASKFETKINIAVEAAVMNRILSLPPKFFSQYSSGELSERGMYVTSLCSTIMNTITGVGITSLFSLVYIGQVFAFAPSLVVPSLIVSLISIVFSILVSLRQIKFSKQIMDLSAKENGMSYALISGIQKIKLAGAEKRMYTRWLNLFQKSAYLKYNPPLLVRLSSVINLAITLGGDMIIYSIAIGTKVGVADFYAFNSAFANVSGALGAVASIATIVSTIKPTIDMAKPILETIPEFSEGKEIITTLQGGIEVSNVSFKYSDDSPNIFENFTLKIKPGEYVGIVGKTGCGKSTLVRLLLGFETPQKGSVFYDNKDIRSVDVKSLRNKIGVVTQNGKLFLGDIYNNIVISAPQTTLEGAWEAAEIASIAEDIRQLPMGMNTLICEGQGGVSGGQKQRLMIARAIVGKPKILIFDEATSALDNITQANISNAIDKLKCTRIVIAHRLSTIKNCQRIIVLDHGQIIESGTYDELIKKDGFFASLVARQRIDIDAE